MHLSKKAIQNIETHINENTIVEVRQKGMDILIQQHPIGSNDIELPPTLTSNEEYSTIIITVQKPGDRPIELQRVEVEPGFWLAGLKGFIERP